MTSATWQRDRASLAAARAATSARIAIFEPDKNEPIYIYIYIYNIYMCRYDEIEYARIGDAAGGGNMQYVQPGAEKDEGHIYFYIYIYMARGLYTRDLN
jgi:hypothetical protein